MIMEMTVLTTTRHRGGRVPIALTCVIALGSGCGPDPNAFPWSASRPSVSDAAFEAGANRPPTTKTLYAMTRILAARGRDPECEQLLRRILRESPGCLPAYCDLAALYLRHGRIDEAIETLSRGLRIAPEDAVLQNNQGMCWTLKGEYRKALRRFTKAATVAPQDARYRTNMAVALSMIGRYDEAKSLFEQVVPEEDVHYNLSILASARNDSGRAIDEFKQSGRVVVEGRHPVETIVTR